MKTIIIEDEPLSSMYLAALLQQWYTGINIVAQARNLVDASDAIKEHEPDLLFLDIQLEEESGLSLLESMRENFPKIIITTALAHQTTRLIQPSGVPYLQKPVDKDDLIEAMEKINQIHQDDFQIRARLLYQYYSAGGFPTVIYADTVHEPGLILNLNNVILIESKEDNTVFQLPDGKAIQAENINYRLFQQLINPGIFFRIDKNRHVNLNYIDKLMEAESSLHLTNGRFYSLTPEMYQGLVSVLNKQS